VSETKKSAAPKVGALVRDEAGRYGLVVPGAEGAVAVVWLPPEASCELPLSPVE